MKMLFTEALARAIDEQDATLAASAVDWARGHGMTYSQILAKVQEVRPSTDAGDWDALLYEADSAEADS